eukprot:6363452-Prymnesium_polylepis.1
MRVKNTRNCRNCTTSLAIAFSIDLSSVDIPSSIHAASSPSPSSLGSVVMTSAEETTEATPTKSLRHMPSSSPIHEKSERNCGRAGGGVRTQKLARTH